MPKRGASAEFANGGHGALRRRLLLAVLAIAAGLLLLNAWLVSQ